MKTKVWKFGDDVSTDLIAPSRYFHLRSTLHKMAEHVLEDVVPEFSKKINKGDMIVAGKNFGCGSSREHAPAIIKIAGVGAVMAKSFSRIFFRNAINIGLPVIECDTDLIEQGDELEIDLAGGVVKNLTRRKQIKFASLPPVMTTILSDGGLVEHIKKHGDFKLE